MPDLESAALLLDQGLRPIKKKKVPITYVLAQRNWYFFLFCMSWGLT